MARGLEGGIIFATTICHAKANWTSVQRRNSPKAGFSLGFLRWNIYGAASNESHPSTMSKRPVKLCWACVHALGQSTIAVGLAGSS